MSPEEERIQRDMVENLLKLNEMMEPMLEHAEGMKGTLEKRGWSPSAAEKVALEMLLRMIRG